MMLGAAPGANPSTVALTDWSPPPNNRTRPPRYAAAASCVGAVRSPAGVTEPDAGSIRNTPVADAPAGPSPPSTYITPGTLATAAPDTGAGKLQEAGAVESSIPPDPLPRDWLGCGTRG